jgi:hypothetical protein
VTEWEHAFEFRPGKHTLWDHTFELPGSDVSNAAVVYRVATGPAIAGIYDFPGTYAQRFDGLDKRHSHSGSALYVGTRRSGIYVHGWPPCNLTTCIIVVHEWDRLRLAMAGEKSLSFSVVI